MKKLKIRRFRDLIEYLRKSNTIRMYILLVMVPLLLADFAFGYILIRADQSELSYKYDSDISALNNQLNFFVDNASNFAIEIERNERLNEFLNTVYLSNTDYYTKYMDITQNSFLATKAGSNDIFPKIYVDNYTFVNGAEFAQMNSIKDKRWYKEFIANDSKDLLLFYYDDDMSVAAVPQRRLFYIKKLRTYGTHKRNVIVRIEIDYSSLVQQIHRSNYSTQVIISKNGKILLDGKGTNNLYQNFDDLGKDISVGKTLAKNEYGTTFDIVALEGKSDVLELLWGNRFFVIILLLINMVFPAVFLSLTQTLQEGKLKEQEMDIARQNAELLALHSQINPHFLFNALESIRMHSILRNEEETARMVEKLAIIERKNADWNEDFIEIDNEMEFTEAYLGLQKYRFGDRLNYEIDIDEECRHLKIPKLTIVTFVENACVHGIEGKSTQGWIFVSASLKDENLIVEIEDTGEGISEEELEILRSRIDNASIDDLKNKGRIGMINACLRLKMATQDTVKITFDSEESVGTTIQIIMPQKYCYQNREGEYA
ncbi:MAG: histidine kinase [Lachnospiraceae bacterium]|nr:histidine kinase [Lachnospiraceae bacterium]